MRKAASEPDPVKADPLIFETLSVCADAEEWLAALREYPAAMGLTEQAEIGDLELRVVCYEHEETPVCRDAASSGRL